MTLNQSGDTVTIVAEVSVDGWIDACDVHDLAWNEVRQVTTTTGTTIDVYRLEDGFFATAGICTHGRASLAGGVVIDGMIECPKHNGRFNIKTGEAIRKPVSKPLETFECRLESGVVKVCIHGRSSSKDDDGQA